LTYNSGLVNLSKLVFSFFTLPPRNSLKLQVDPASFSISPVHAATARKAVFGSGKRRTFVDFSDFFPFTVI
jgi:hypothetical protein